MHIDETIRNPELAISASKIVKEDLSTKEETTVLQEKLDRRRKHIDETIQNPETAVSASKIVKHVSSTTEETTVLQDKLNKRRNHVDKTIQNPDTVVSPSMTVKPASSTKETTSLQKKLEKQRTKVEDALENPTPVKALVQQSDRMNQVSDNASSGTMKNGSKEKASTAKKGNTVVSKKDVKKRIELPVVEDDSSLMTKLDKRRKKIEEIVPEEGLIEESVSKEDLTFSNKLPKKDSVVKNNDETSAKGEKKENIKQQRKETNSKATKERKASRVSKKVGTKNLDVSMSRKSSDDQDYFTAAEESLHLPRPRRNCKKKFENLEGLASANRYFMLS